MDEQIKENLAKLSFEDSECITRLWINELNIKYNDDIAVSDALIKAVNDLICLCKTAVDTDQDLVHIWFG